MSHPSLLALLRRATGRRVGAALAFAALLVQVLAVVSPMRAYGAVPWDDAAAICHSPAGDDLATGSGGGEPDRGDHPACPLCFALHHLGKLLPPADTAIPPFPAATRLALAPPADDPVAARFDRMTIPRMSVHRRDIFLASGAANPMLWADHP